jgi:uncharacterized RDD family membrane protein YckC
MAAATVVCLLTVTSAIAQDVEIGDREWGHTAVRIGQSYTLKPGDSVREVVVVYSPATIEGHVRGNVAIVVGTVNITRTAVIDGSLVVVGGTATIQPGAIVRQDLVIAGGALEAPRDFVAGGQHIVIGTAGLADRIRGFVPWLTEGLLIGRLIVPRLEWVWLVVAVVFLISLALCLVFMDQVRTCADTIARRPLRTFLVGLLVLLLTGPVVVLLAASVIGLAVVPFLLCALVIAWVIGKVGVNVRIGDSIVGQPAPATRADSVRSFILGFAVLALAYMVPVLGLVTWALIGVMGLGAATLAFSTAYRRESSGGSRKTAPVVSAPAAAVVVGPPAAAVSVDAPAAVVLTDAPAAAVVNSAPAAAVINSAPAAAVAADPMIAEPVVTPPSVPRTPPVAHATLPPATSLPLASFLERTAAMILDFALIMIVNDALDFRHGGPTLLLVLAYHIGFWTWRGATVGGLTCRLRVVRVDGAPLEFVDAMVRGLSGLFALGAAGIGFLWILKDPHRQGWHDKIAGTYVVKLPRM